MESWNSIWFVFGCYIWILTDLNLVYWVKKPRILNSHLHCARKEFERGATNVLLCAELKWADVTKYKPNPWSDGLQLHSSPASCELCKKSINIEIFKSWSTGARLGCSKLAVHIFCYSLSKWTIAKSRTRKGLANSLSPQFHIKCPDKFLSFFLEL